MDEKLLLKQESTEPFSPTAPKRKSVEEGRGITVWLVVAYIACLLGSCIPSGYSLGGINTPQEVIREWMRESMWERYGTRLNSEQEVTLWSVIVSLFVCGGILGSFMGPVISDCMGRRSFLLLNHLLSLSSALLLIGTKLVNSVEMLLLGRFISGLCSGTATWLVPLYMGEIAPSSLRGVMGVTLPLGLNVGVVLSQLLGMDIFLGTKECWSYLLGGFMVMVVLALLLHPFLPESPTYYFLVTKDQDKGHNELQLLRGKDSKQAEAEESALELVVQTLKNEGDDVGSWSVADLMRSQVYRLPLLITVLLNAGQQLAGINAVFYYSTLIFQTAGLDLRQSQGASIGAGAINVVMGVMAIPLVRYCRRRVLLLWSLVGCVLSQAVLMVALKIIPYVPMAAYVAIIALLAFVLAYGFGLGPVPYMVAMELFPAGPRAVGIAMGGTANWSSNLVVGLTFPLVQEFIGELSFCFFILSSSLLIMFVYKFLPETLGDVASTPALEVERVSDNDTGTANTTVPAQV